MAFKPFLTLLNLFPLGLEVLGTRGSLLIDRGA